MEMTFSEFADNYIDQLILNGEGDEEKFAEYALQILLFAEHLDSLGLKVTE